MIPPAMISTDTIAAISSAVGAAARMIVRMSGPDAHRIARQLVIDEFDYPFVSFRKIRIGDIESNGWVYLFATPRSYTGEDSAEFHIPGNALLAKMLLRKLIDLGARQAESGEFTARAYFNGRIDLSQAEGVAATIAAASDAELHAARRLLSGELAKRLHPAMDWLAELLALIEAGIDFSEEDISFVSPEQIQNRIDRIDSFLANLMSDSVRFERLHHLPRIVLVGRPNAGKSTLLNALAGEERAIVSPVAGTTRDALSAELPLLHGMVHLIDVAGVESESIDDGADAPAAVDIARQMRRRAIEMIQQADRVVLIHDCTDVRPDPQLPRTADLTVYTKVDLRSDFNNGFHVSARTGQHLDQLCARLDVLAFGASVGPSLAMNARHVQLIQEAREALARARQSVAGAGLEVIALELREALNSLGGILGQISPDEVLGRVFSTFCIGK